jgi:hypothetical protein
VGQKIRLNGTPYEVVGVLPETFTFLRNDTLRRPTWWC